MGSGSQRGTTQTDSVVEEILERFDLDSGRYAGKKRMIRDLAAILAADYEGAVDRFLRDGQLPLRDLAKRATELLSGFGEVPLHFDEVMACFTEPPGRARARVRMDAHGGAGHPLRGFYYGVPHDEGPPVIWLNLCHVSTAVAASFAHELGHWFWDDLHRTRPGQPLPFYNAAFAEHLGDPHELFADCFTTISAYPTKLARRLFSRRGWPRDLRGLRKREGATVEAVHGYLQKEYGADLGSASGLPTPRRFYYITSMIYFARVRAAVLRIAGI